MEEDIDKSSDGEVVGVPEIHDEKDYDQFVEFINEGYLSIQIYKLRDGHIDQIWDLQEWLEYNKEKTGQLFKNIVRWPSQIATKETYIVILFEKIL